jgi:peptidoglycan/xylan/chitin deacetylase (PgdA/CDA1 family)
MSKISLTFDNGPEPEITPQVLELLDSRCIKATFFVVGEKLADRARRRLAERARAEGHWVGNHTLTHSLPLGLRHDGGSAAYEICRTQRAIGDLSHPDRLFRPFGGGGQIGKLLLNAEARDCLRDGAYTCVLWNCVPRDWEDPDGWVDRALAQLREQPWTVIVLHDLPTGAMRNLARFIDQAGATGAEFVQEFPDECVPIRRGIATMAVDQFVQNSDNCKIPIGQ